jgi:hypothetical protein
VKNTSLKKTYKPAVMFTLFCALLTSACSSIESTIDAMNVFKDRPPLLCPEVSVLADSERITIFKEGQGRDIIDIKTEAMVDDFVAKCIYQVDDDTMVGQVLVELNFGYTVSRGPANQEGTYSLPYFVTILDNNKRILNKGVFEVGSSFSGNRYRLSGYDEPIVMAIPVAPPVTGIDFSIYIGFQLTPEQITYNQRGG